jgi:hypothetical protein
MLRAQLWTDRGLIVAQLWTDRGLIVVCPLQHSLYTIEHAASTIFIDQLGTLHQQGHSVEAKHLNQG